jgi:hypothetical protein
MLEGGSRMLGGQELERQKKQEAVEAGRQEQEG